MFNRVCCNRGLSDICILVTLLKVRRLVNEFYHYGEAAEEQQRSVKVPFMRGDQKGRVGRD